MAGTVPTITPNSITDIRALSSRPVFFLNLNGSPVPNLVVKGDARQGASLDQDNPLMTPEDTAFSIHWTSKLMKNVQNPLVNTKIMTPAEVGLFKQAVVLKFAQQSQQYTWVTIMAGQYNWVKMPYVPGLSDAGYVDVRAAHKNTDLAVIKEAIPKLSETAVWRDLGRVVAVDIFNGNNDRFDIKTGDCVNPGNIMFVTDPQTRVTRAIGLDTYDPNSVAANLAIGNYDENCLRILIDPGRCFTFAIACVRSVGSKMKDELERAGVASIGLSVVQPDRSVAIRKITMDELPTLFMPYALDFEAGIVAGAQRLKEYLQSKVRQYASLWRPVMPSRPGGGLRLGGHRYNPKVLPQGIIDRMTSLGWYPV